MFTVIVIRLSTRWFATARAIASPFATWRTSVCCQLSIYGLAIRPPWFSLSVPFARCPACCLAVPAYLVSPSYCLTSVGHQPQTRWASTRVIPSSSRRRRSTRMARLQLLFLRGTFGATDFCFQAGFLLSGVCLTCSLARLSLADADQPRVLQASQRRSQGDSRFSRPTIG